MHSINIEKIHQNIWQRIPPAWPVKSMVAINGLMGFVDYPFKDACTKAKSTLSIKIKSKQMKSLNQETAKWFQVFFDEGQATFPMPGKDKGFYGAIHAALIHDHALHKGNSIKIKWLKALPNCPKACVHGLIPKDLAHIHLHNYLEKLICSLPGWASHVRYCAWHASETDAENWMWGYTALRLMMGYLLDILPSHVLDNTIALPFTTHNTFKILEQNEACYQKQVISKLSLKGPRIKKEKPHAQFIFCIDVRSEPLRRAFEKENCETFGMAGFFGLPIAFQDQDRPLSNHCPVILKPNYTVPRHLKPQRQKEDQKKQGFYKPLYQSVKYNFTTPFATAELLGPYSGLIMLLKNIWPTGIHKLRDFALGKKNRINAYIYDLSAVPLDEKISLAKSVIQTLGLKTFAPYVVIVGHASTTENNIFASSLQCGACGGHAGSSNADVLVEILNDPIVKKAVHIPNMTTFVSATHDTTQNKLCVNTEDPVLLEILGRAHKHLGATPFHLKNSYSWHNVRPEWGLARNALFVVGKRTLTESLDLEGRSFLQSYDHKTDPDGTLLSTIIGGPVFVGHWINSQYLFSTINNKLLGTGNKITANVTGKMGIVQGNGGDLFHGLSFQSLFHKEGEPYHEIIRLHVVLQAPKILIEKVMHQNPVFDKLVRHEWIHLFQIDDKGSPLFKMNHKGKWSLIQ